MAARVPEAQKMAHVADVVYGDWRNEHGGAL